jgi:predicted nuclease of predicted toxin-antitoxin system
MRGLMNFSLLLDEDFQAKYLINLLKASNYDILTVSEAGLESVDDKEVLEFSVQQKRALLTRNCNDFLKLHQLNSNHFGILAVYQDSDPLKNMSYQGIVQAIGNPLIGAENFYQSYVRQ